MSQEKFDCLVVDYGKEKVLQMCDRLDEFADINPKRFKQYGCHGTVIRKWIREDKEKQVKFAAKKPVDEKENELLAKKIAKEYPKLMAMQKIDIGYNYIEFKGSTHSTCIKFSDNGFKEQVISELRKLGIPIKEEK